MDWVNFWFYAHNQSMLMNFRNETNFGFLFCSVSLIKIQELLWLVQYFCLLNWRSLPFGRTCINAVERCDRSMAVHHRMVHHCKHPLCRAVERIRLANYTITIIRWVVDMDIFKRYLDFHLTITTKCTQTCTYTRTKNENRPECNERRTQTRVSWQCESKNHGQ